MICAISPFSMAQQWRKRFAPLLIGALRKNQWRMGCAIVVFPTAHQWRNGAQKASEFADDWNPNKPREDTMTDIVDVERIGRGREYILARLDRDGHAALAAKVRAGKLSANAAAIKAGFRNPPATPFERIIGLLPKLSAAECAELERLIRDRRDASL